MVIVFLTTGWGHLMARMPVSVSDTAAVIMMVMILAVPILLLWFIAWRRSNVARWIYVVIHGAGLIMAPFRPPTSISWGAFWAALTFGQYICIVLCLWMLFRPDARDWFAGAWPVDPNIFD